MRVLVVDDEAQSLEFIVRSLEPGDFDLMCFSDVPPALKYMLKHPIDVAVIDFQLRGPNGLAFAAKIHHVQPACTIVMVSHYAGLADMQRGFAVQVDDFVSLPCSSAALLKRVNDAIAPVQKADRNERKSLDPATVLCFLDFDPDDRTIDCAASG